VTRSPTVVAPAATVPVGDRSPTFGLEEEFLLLWPDGNVACVAPEVIDRVPPSVPAHAEFTRYQVEATTGVCIDLTTAARELSVARRVLAETAAESGARLVAGGAAPFGAPGVSALTDDPRYRRLVDRMPLVSGDEGTCACHVHLGVADRDLGVRVLNRIRSWLPTLLALNVNSPLWRGRPSGWSSYRFAVQRRWPTFAPPPLCRDSADYDLRLAECVDSGDALDLGSIYWWARLSPRYPTVEIRIADVGSSTADAVLLAGLARHLVTTATADAVADRPWFPFPDRVLVGAALDAARHGAGALVVSPLTGRTATALEALDDLLSVITPAAEAQGEAALIRELLVDRLRRGSGADRQRALWASGPRPAFVQAMANVTAELDLASALRAPQPWS
jgi:glutamate---cysteine ligase / carboxylate-amine ligase